ncbi:type 1 glutamine amidotransferase domain-containing protein [Paractinoplanes durhamensis]|uniref:Dihydroxyacetone kinase n=1 Tax=Paractinoplanes durhamensis TaxID=113563 RepID=A0ABQ3ZBJ8_9ACTN|nr:type 1 glutamine amidotransferase domain-containing protein [Actinoplanes durhamensis]GIE07211.1 dihydroxyacetone kinase [Actinoplanes durhamensis]
MATKKIAIVLTSHEALGDTGKKTGYYVGEAAHPWAEFVDAGYAVDLLSIAGGTPPTDGEDRSDPVQERYLTDADVTGQLAATRPVRDADQADYDAVLLAGGHGTMWDFPGSTELQALVRDVYERGGVVAAVCHGPAGLVDVRLSSGEHLVAGRTVSAFTNSEESAVGLTEVVPFALQTRLEQVGAKHIAGPDWQPKVVRDGRLVTGQNPQSAAGVGSEVLKALADN